MDSNIIRDDWLSSVLRKQAYKVVVNKALIRDKGESLGGYLQEEGAFFYSKVSVADIPAIRFLQDIKFNLIDTNIVLNKQISREMGLKSDALIRFAGPEDEQEAVELGRKSFLFSRFHRDENFTPDIADNIKAEWVRSYFLGKRGQYMVLALVENKIKGFLQLLRDKDDLVIDLLAVDNSVRNKGLASDMIAYAETYCNAAGRIRTGTQLVNIPSLRLYERLGFRVRGSFYVFHYHSPEREEI